MAESITWTNQVRKLKDLQPWARNPRQIDQHQAKRLAESFQEFGQVETIAIGPGNEVYNGHQRLAVLLKKHGPEFEVEVRVSSRPLTEKEREKLTVFLHKGAAGEWNFDILANQFEMGDLLEWGFSEKELLGAGFEMDEPEGEAAEPQIDKAEELRQKWQVETGQMWKLGEHRIICGDCTDRAVVERVMGGEKANMVFTDPPYNVAIVGGTHDPRSPKYQSGNSIENDDMDDEEFYKKLTEWFSSMNSAMRAGAAFYVCSPAGRTETQFRNALNSIDGLPLRECIVWAKNSAVFGRQDYHWRHESILYGWKDGAAHYFTDDHKQDTVWEVDRPTVSEFHPTMKPVELPEKAIRNSSRVGEIIFDGFSGSGTTLIACERLHRKCRAVEISPAYVAVAIQRWVDTTGGTPELVSENGQ